MKRIFLFLLTNILVIATLSLISNALGLYGYFDSYGLDYYALASICLLWGMGGSIIALMLSRWTAKMMMNVSVISPDTTIQQERNLLNTVYSIARRAGLQIMPEVGLYHSKELNAFATGPTKNRALVAVSTGLLNSMTADEIEGVLAHEVTHITNGDMVTMTLIQGVINAFSMFLSRVIAYIVHNMLVKDRSDERHKTSPALYHSLAIIFDIIFTLLGSLVVAAFSRYREYRADKGGAHLVGRHKMIAALEHLRSATTFASNGFVEPLKINRKRSHFLSLLASHPDIGLRIEALNS